MIRGANSILVRNYNKKNRRKAPFAAVKLQLKTQYLFGLKLPETHYWEV